MPHDDVCYGEDIHTDDVCAAFDGTQVYSETKNKQPAFINAFELIAISNDLSGLFEKNGTEMRRRFLSDNSAQETTGKILAATKALGLSAERASRCKVRIHECKNPTRRRGPCPSLSLEVIGVAPSLSVVEIWKSDECKVEYTKLCSCLSSIFTDTCSNPQIATLDETKKITDATGISSNGSLQLCDLQA
eukprot:TRINITY_DN3892_c0_g1_i14.p1 TRINITY_DN3892_c0_g1~~TRINITY_DN3892_c0_g1_i14.p1  ORF type:complete len:190 (-),score=29.33 TRINITY_DN3892_c0_g1_i14:405-974(-)